MARTGMVRGLALSAARGLNIVLLLFPAAGFVWLGALAPYDSSRLLFFGASILMIFAWAAREFELADITREAFVGSLLAAGMAAAVWGIAAH
jgi:hypothetical protein